MRFRSQSSMPLGRSTITPTMMAFIDGYIWITAADTLSDSESTSIPKNPRTDRPVGYAFVDLSTPSEAERAITELSGKEILERKVSVQLARKPEPAGEKTEGAVSGGDGAEGTEGGRRRQSGRGRGRGRGRGGRTARAGDRVSFPLPNSLDTTLTTSQPEGEVASEEVLPLQDITNQATDEAAKDDKKAARAPRERRERGPPADGIPSKNKVMVANLPYDLSEEKVSSFYFSIRRA